MRILRRALLLGFVALFFGLVWSIYQQDFVRHGNHGLDAFVGAFLTGCVFLLVIGVFLWLIVLVSPLIILGAGIAATVGTFNGLSALGYPFVGVLLALPVGIITALIGAAIVAAVSSGGGAHISGWFTSD